VELVARRGAPGWLERSLSRLRRRRLEVVAIPEGSVGRMSES
jgi:hypothetical protein